MTHVWPLLGLAPVPTVVSMNFRPVSVSVVMAFPCVCAAAGWAAARVAVAIRTRRVIGMWLAFPRRGHGASDTKQMRGSQPRSRLRAPQTARIEWRRGRDSNPRYGFTPYNGLANRRLRPLGHLSASPLRPRQSIYP